MSRGLWEETLLVAEYCLSQSCTCPRHSSPPPSEMAAAMWHLVQDMEKHNLARFLSLVQSFMEGSGSDPCSSLRKVMKELVGDGHLNWGRVVSLFTFTAVLARQLHERGRKLGLDPQQDQCRALAETIADYLGEEKKDWMLENDGWVGSHNIVC